MKMIIYASVVLAFAAAAVVVSAAPGLLSGVFTHLGNNPAFMCNKAPTTGESYDNVVIETRLNKFKNEDDDLYTGSDCEVLPLDDCDVTVKGYIDTNTPTENWPANMQMTELVQEWDGNDVVPNYDNQHSLNSKQHAYTACKFIPQSLSLATIRVALEDVDTGLRNDVINHFNCHWSASAADIAPSAADAQWMTINCCTAFTREMKSTVKHELLMDVRAYRDRRGDASCPNGEGRFA